MRRDHALEDVVIELQDEVAHLRAQIKQLWKVVKDLQSSVHGGEDQVSDSRSTSQSLDRLVQRRSSSGYSTSEEPRSPEQRPFVPGPAVSSVTPSVAPTPSTATLSWLEREEICDQIGRFLARSISGGHRGASGRDKIPLPSHLGNRERLRRADLHSGESGAIVDELQVALPADEPRVWRQCLRGASLGARSQEGSAGSTAHLAFSD